MLKPGDDVVDGLRTLDPAGHTPGGGPRGSAHAADVINNEIVSFEYQRRTIAASSQEETGMKIVIIGATGTIGKA